MGKSACKFSLKGRVLINKPIIRSNPCNSAGLPETVTPKITSSPPLYLLSKIAQAALTKVLTVI